MNVRTLHLAILLVAGLFVMDCGEISTDSVVDVINAFPLTAGSSWEYLSFSSTIYYQNTLPPDYDTTRLTILIEGPDTVLGIENSVIALYTQYPINEDFPLRIRKWLGLENNILKEYAWQQINEHLSPISYDQPKVLLDFPLNVGKNWISSREWMDFYLDYFVTQRAVIGMDNIVNDENMFNCAIVSVKTELEQNDSLIITYKEWYSNEGLIRKEYPNRIRYIRDMDGAILDTCEYSFRSELSEINIVH